MFNDLFNKCECPTYRQTPFPKRRPAEGRRHIARFPHGPAARSFRALVPALAGHMPLLRAIRRSGTLIDTPMTGDALHAVVRRRAEAAGLPGPIGFHSLRAGFVTTARRNGADHRSVRRQTRHTSDAMIETYDRDHAPLVGNAVTRLGL